MCDEWMPVIELPITIEQFHQLPRNSAYKYEYLNGRALLSPRPKHYHALLELKPMAGDAGVGLRPIVAQDFADLTSLFAAIFRSIQPFGSLDDEARRAAAMQSLERTRTGGDGPWIERASFVALAEDRPIGAILITLLPDGDPRKFDSYRWIEPPPADCIARRLGRPHLTWIFVSPWEAGHGVGTALLAASTCELLHMGYAHLLSTFLMGNDSSLLWHWRNGFELLANPGSWRHMKDQWQPLAVKNERQS